MNNFGVIELASAKTTNAPGWAYVPDRQPPPPQTSTSTSTSNRKRARAAAAGAAPLSLADANARQEAKARREIEILDRDNARDVQIAIPPKPGSSGVGGISRTGGKKFTPNVRRILQSQKTFANHLDDYVALLSQQEANPNSNANAGAGGGGGTPAVTETTTAAAAAARRASTAAVAGQSRQASASATPSTAKKPTALKQEQPDDVEMPDAADAPSSAQEQQPRSTILTPYPRPPPSLPGDDNPLLVSRLPPLPSDDELRALLAAPPLSYLEARGAWPASGQQYPTRTFCSVCGYWGRVRCMKCGTRVCALECLETHQEECITRYGL